MALPDTPIELPHVRRRRRRDRVYGALAAVTMGAAAALWTVELGVGAGTLGLGWAMLLSLAGALFTVAWLITSLERRLIIHLQHIEGARYRDGYAAGYLDAANKFRGEDRRTLRPVN